MAVGAPQMPASLRLLVILAALAASVGVALAQNAPGGGSPDVAPTAKPDQQPPQHENTRLQTTINVLAKRSVFFPELAFNKGSLDAQEKLELAVDETVSPSRFLGSAFTAGIGQARDSLPGYGEEWAGYGKRFGSSVASNASSHLFGTFLLPSILHQDPRYFVKLYGSAAARVGYAIDRVVVTRTDDGRQTFNWSFVLGGLMAEGLATAYLPPSERTAAKTFERFGIRMSFSAVSNVVKEYWPTIFKSLRMTKIAPSEHSDPGTVAPSDRPPRS